MNDPPLAWTLPVIILIVMILVVPWNRFRKIAFDAFMLVLLCLACALPNKNEDVDPAAYGKR